MESSSYNSCCFVYETGPSFLVNLRRSFLLTVYLKGKTLVNLNKDKNGDSFHKNKE